MNSAFINMLTLNIFFQFTITLFRNYFIIETMLDATILSLRFFNYFTSESVTLLKNEDIWDQNFFWDLILYVWGHISIEWLYIWMYISA